MTVEIAVHCSYDKLESPDKLVRNPRNPNTHTDSQIALLTKIIAYQGWRNPIAVSTRSGFIIKGHARLSAAEILECSVVPVDYQDYENEAEEWLDMIADNRIAELAEMDKPLLKDLLEDLDTGDLDMDLTGFDADSLELLMSEIHPEDYSDLTGQNRSLAGMEEAEIVIAVPTKDKNEVEKWLADGNPMTAPGMGLGVLKRCGLL